MPTQTTQPAAEASLEIPFKVFSRRSLVEFPIIEAEAKGAETTEIESAAVEASPDVCFEFESQSFSWHEILVTSKFIFNEFVNILEGSGPGSITATAAQGDFFALDSCDVPNYCLLLQDPETTKTTQPAAEASL